MVYGGGNHNSNAHCPLLYSLPMHAFYLRGMQALRPYHGARLA